VINAGRGRIGLPLDDFDGEIEVNGGEIRVCAPPGLGVRVREDVTFGSVVHGGLRAGRGTSTWESDAFATALHQADLSVTVHAGSVLFNPEGGCG
jgi:hypothetical protein